MTCSLTCFAWCHLNQAVVPLPVMLLRYLRMEAILYLIISFTYMLRIINGESESSEALKKCVHSGYQCSEDCRTILYCPTALGAGYVISNCGDFGKFCDRYTVSCSDKPCTNNRQPFLCTSADTFPDPYDCSSSFFCPVANEPPAYRCSCPPDLHYDTKTGDCKEGVCPRQDEPICKTASEMKPFKDDPRYYYICNENLIPLEFKCKEDYIFKHGECHKPEKLHDSSVNLDVSIVVNATFSRRFCQYYETTVPTSTTPTSTSPFQHQDIDVFEVSSSTQAPAILENTSNIKLTCNRPGELLADTDCHSYWKCDIRLKPLKRRCPTTTYFDAIQKGCTNGNC